MTNRFERAVWILALAAILTVLLLNLPGPAGACAAVAPGYRPPPPSLAAIASRIGPPLLVFLLGEYVALASKRRAIRVVGSSLVLVATIVLAELAWASIPPCGPWT